MATLNYQNFILASIVLGCGICFCCSSCETSSYTRMLQQRDADRKQMSYQDYFRYYAATGVADAEAPEFKALNDKYGEKPGNPCTTTGPDFVGIWVYYPLSDSSSFLQLELRKQIGSGNLSMIANYCRKRTDGLPDCGNPEISMDIPMAAFDSILHSGLGNQEQHAFLNTASKSQWAPVGDAPYMPSPPVRLDYHGRTNQIAQPTAAASAICGQ